MLKHIIKRYFNAEFSRQASAEHLPLLQSEILRLTGFVSTITEAQNA